MLNKGAVRQSVIVVIGVTVLLGAAAAGLYFFFPSAVTPVPVSEDGEIAVCSTEIVTRYNEVMATVTATREDVEYVGRQINELSEEIRQRPHYEKDPTCLYIVYTAADANQDELLAERTAGQLQSALDGGADPDDELEGVIPIEKINERYAAPEEGVEIDISSGSG